MGRGADGVEMRGGRNTSFPGGRRRRRLRLGLLLLAVLVLAAWGRGWGSRPHEAVFSFLEGRTVVLDPGHGGPDPGSVGARGTLEKDVVLAVALLLRDHLEVGGTRVIMTRTDD